MTKSTIFGAAAFVAIMLVSTFAVQTLLNNGASADTPSAGCTVNGAAVPSGKKVSGTKGPDKIDCSRAMHGVFIDGGKGSDAITGSAFDDRIMGGFGCDWIFGGAGDDLIDGGKGDDIPATGPVTGSAGCDGTGDVSGSGPAGGLFGGDGDDTIKGGPGDDLLSGGDHVVGDTCSGGPGTDANPAGDCEPFTQ